MKPFVDPALRAIEPPIDDDPSEPYLDELDTPADSFEFSESSSHDNDTNFTAENDTRSPLHSQEAPDSSNKQGDYDQIVIDNQSIFAAERILKKRKRKGKLQMIRSNGLAILKINRPGNQRRIFWINVLSNILSMAKSEISENPVCRSAARLNTGRPIVVCDIWSLYIKDIPLKPRIPANRITVEIFIF